MADLRVHALTHLPPLYLIFLSPISITPAFISQNRTNFYFFFFSSRRRHTRCSRDWSSDVCSSDLAKIGVHYYKNIDAANDTLAKVRERRSDGFIVQADVNRTDDIRGMMDHVKSEFGKLDIFVSNARPEISEFYKPPMEIRVEQWQQAINSQATAFLLGAQLAAPLMGRGGRIIAITHSPGARSGSWQPWVGMGSAKAAMESLVRYFADPIPTQGC